VAEGPGWSVKAVRRGRSADLPLGLTEPSLPIRPITRKGADRTIGAIAMEETNQQRQTIVRGSSTDYPWKSRARPYATSVILPGDREDRDLDALIRAVRPRPATAHDRLAAEDRDARRVRAKLLAKIQETQRQLARTPSR